MKEIPMALIKANQLGIVILTISSIVFRQPLIIYILFGIEITGLLFGLKWNLFVRIAKLIFKDSINGSQTQAAELTKFNNTLAVLFLLISGLLLIIGYGIAGYIIAAVLAVVVIVALSGFCVGCFLYYQLKRMMK